MSTLSDKELNVLDAISHNSSVSQRELAHETGVSLGLINVIVKKFLKTGYLQVIELNKRKLEYMLTPRGFLAVSRKTYRYTTRTIRDYHLIHKQLELLLTDLTASGVGYFSIHGDGEIRELIMCLSKEILSGSRAILGDQHRDEPDAAVLNVTAYREIPDFRGKVIHVLDCLDLDGSGLPKDTVVAESPPAAKEGS